MFYLGGQKVLGFRNFGYDFRGVGGDVWRWLCRHVLENVCSCGWGNERTVKCAQRVSEDPRRRERKSILWTHHLLLCSYYNWMPPFTFLPLSNASFSRYLCRRCLGSMNQGRVSTALLCCALLSANHQKKMKELTFTTQSLAVAGCQSAGFTLQRGLRGGTPFYSIEQSHEPLYIVMGHTGLW